MDTLTDLLGRVHQVLEVDLPDLLDNGADMSVDIAIVISEVSLVVAKMQRLVAWNAAVGK